VSSINQFPWQDAILRTLRAAGRESIDQISAAITVEAGEGVDSDALTTHTGHDALFHRVVELTPSGESAADSLP